MQSAFQLRVIQQAGQLTLSLRNEGGHGDPQQVYTKPEKVLEFFQSIARLCLEKKCGFWAIVEVYGFNDWRTEMSKSFRSEKIAQS